MLIGQPRLRVEHTSMEAPYTLLSLPKPLDTVYGRVQSAPVSALRGSRKRKRHEIVVGIDGESVNVYNIQNQALQSAYAIPPQTYLCCPPSSYHSKSQDSKSSQRDTFIVLKDGVEDSKRRLVRFTEKASATTEFAVPVKTEHILPDGEILAADVLPPSNFSQHGSPQALVSFDNGEVICVAEDMSRVAWRQSVLSSEDKDSSIEHFCLEDISSAQKGLLKSREDIIAQLQVSDTPSTVLACHIVRKAGSVILRLSALNTSSTRAGLHRLDDVRLPSIGSDASQRSIWHISASAGQLFQLNNGTLYVHDLSGITPRLGLTLKERGALITSFTALSSSLVLVTTSQKAIIYDAKYGSVQASTAFGSHLGEAGGRKRKRDKDDDAVERTPTLHWFPTTGIAIASMKDLVGLQIGPELYQTSKAMTGSIQLSSVIGKSAAISLMVDGDALDRSSRRQEKWRTRLEDIIAKNDEGELDAFVFQDFKLDTSTEQTTSTAATEGNDLLWDLENGPQDLMVAKKAKALDLLRRMFTHESSNRSAEASEVRLHIHSRNITRWLFAADILTPANLSIVLNRAVTIEDIAQALITADPSFQLVQDVLKLSIHLPIQFSVRCLRLLIRSLDTMSRFNGHIPMDADSTMDTSVSQDAELDLEASAAEAELSNAVVTLQSGLEIRSITMRLLFGRLHAFPKSALTKHLRQGLQTRDLVFFVHLLRIELAEAGWTRPYVEMGSEDDGQLPSGPMGEDEGLDEEPSPSDRAIRTIGNLLVAAIDAVGPAGWLVGLTTDQDEQSSLLDALHAEISASLEGVYEAQALRGYLDEFERYTLSIIDEATSSRPKSGVIQVHNPTAVEDGVIMPLGGRSTTVAARMSTSKRGAKSTEPAHAAKVKQSEIMIGLYQFERIRV